MYFQKKNYENISEQQGEFRRRCLTPRERVKRDYSRILSRENYANEVSRAIKAEENVNMHYAILFLSPLRVHKRKDYGTDEFSPSRPIPITSHFPRGKLGEEFTTRTYP